MTSVVMEEETFHNLALWAVAGQIVMQILAIIFIVAMVWFVVPRLEGAFKWVKSKCGGWSSGSENFRIGKFWIFTFTGLITVIATSCLHILGYFAVVGMSTPIMMGVAFIATPEDLLWKINYITTFLYMAFAIILVITFENQIYYVVKNIRVCRESSWRLPVWVSTGVRYSDAIMLTTISFIALYYCFTLIGIAASGSHNITTEVARSLPEGSYAAMWSNLASVICPAAAVFVAGWIISFWMLATGHLLRKETKLLSDIIVDIIKTIFSNLYEILQTGDAA